MSAKAGMIAMGVLAFGIWATIGVDVYRRHPHLGEPRPMTRADVECDLPGRTITIKPGFYNDGNVIKLCGWARTRVQPIDCYSHNDDRVADLISTEPFECYVWTKEAS